VEEASLVDMGVKDLWEEGSEVKEKKVVVVVVRDVQQVEVEGAKECEEVGVKTAENAEVVC
jgi:undecaprenyl pyrophosphate synthase